MATNTFLKKILGDPNKKELKRLEEVAEQVNAIESQFTSLSDEQLQAKTAEFKQRHKDGESLDDLLPEAFATVREAAKRMLGQRHYDVQLMGGAALHQGQIAEMRTGEGKTLTSTLPVYLNAISGKGGHVVTVNDYLAKRDAVWMGQIYHFLGLTIGIIQTQNRTFIYDKDFSGEPVVDKEVDETGSFDVQDEYLRPANRAEAYQCDITYGTNNEFGFDYLRDNMVSDVSQMTQRPYNYAIIDEIDSILIDEARTPLIISAPAQGNTDEYSSYARLVLQLVKDEDYEIDEKRRATTFSDAGITKMEKLLGMDNIYVEGGVRTVHHIEQALKAHALFEKDKDYVVRDGEVIIVDQFTGRLMPGRRYSEGLHQAIEAKEGVAIQQESQTLGTVTFQNYFRMYPKLSGMTGTAETESEEFYKIYGLNVVVVPTNNPIQRIDHQDLIFKTEAGKWNAVIAEVKARHEKGQPVLIGTISIEKNERLSASLTKAGIPHEMLNAKNHEREAEIVAQAGRKGAVTLATNMAGRGVDIVLGGNPSSQELKDEILGLGGLYVIGTERHDSRRIDNQLRGRAGRQGDPGETQFYVSTDDDLMRIFAGDRMKSMMERLQLPDDMPIQHKLISRSLESAQTKVEGNNFDSRKHLLEYDDVLNRHRENMYTQRRRVVDAAQHGKEQLSALMAETVESYLRDTVHWFVQSPDEKTWDFDGFAKEMHELFGNSGAFTDSLKPFWETKDSTQEQKRAQITDHVVEFGLQQYQQVITDAQNAPMLENIERTILLRVFDALWVEHLEAMRHMRSGIGLQGYGQRDPLVEYKRRGHELFEHMQQLIKKDVTYSMMHVRGVVEQYQGLLARQGVQIQGAAKTMGNSRAAMKGAVQTAATLAGQTTESKPRNEAGDKIGRNDPCHCGSNKKFKKCHGAA